MLSFYTFHHFKLEIVIGAAAKAAIVSFNPGSTLATVPTVRELLQFYARTTESGEFALVTEGMAVGYGFIGFFFQFAFAATAATIVAGTVAERCKFEAYPAYALALTGFVYPVVVHSIWSSSGFLTDTTINLSSLITEINDKENWWFMDN